MRENMGLYHGKRVDNGKWVEGYFFETNAPVYRALIIVDMAVDITDGYTVILGFNIVEVIPETVGQYAGLTDKNSKKIFEGDIIKNVWTEDVHTVDWCVDSAVWVLPCVTDERRETTFNSYSGDDYEVIGNIHDNPELLKGGNDE